MWLDYEKKLAGQAIEGLEPKEEMKTQPFKISQKQVEPIESETPAKTAESYFLSGQYKMAVEKINSMDPNQITSDRKLLTALAYSRLGRRPEALDAFREATLKNEGNAPAYFHWGQYLRSVGQYQQSIPKLQKAVLLEPDNQLFKTFAGVAKVQDGSYFSLFWEAEKAIFVDPAPGDWLMITAAMLLDIGDTDQALTMMKYAEIRMEHQVFKQILADPFFQKAVYNQEIAKFYSKVFL
ncbi:MAG: hypothetical protein AAF649_10595 [Verrucomicrobiota bacterium]